MDSIHITQDILLKVGRIDEFKGLWGGLDEHTTSLKLLADVAAFGQSFHQTLGALKDQQIDSEKLRQLHGLLHGSKTKTAFKSEDTALRIMNGDVLVGALETAPPDQVAALTDKLLQWAHTALENCSVHPLIIVAVFSAVFLQVAPFDQGNQKVLHLLLNVFLLKAGYEYAPYEAVQGLMNEQAEEYYNALKNNQNSLETGRPDWSGWLTFFLGVLEQQTVRLGQRLHGQKDQIVNLPTLSAEIMGLFDAHERLQMKQIIKLTGGRRSTIKLRLQELVDGGYLCRHGQARSTWYALV